MTVKLLHNTPLSVCSYAIRTCYQSHSKSDNGGPIDCDLIDRVGNKNRHSSTLEHLVYTFSIDGISRACLQELARHRIASYSVKSTRYTLKELKDTNTCELEKFLIEDIDSVVKSSALDSLRNIKTLLNLPNAKMDSIKYALPECYKTSLTWTINARSLQNFLSLRTSKAALKEIRELALKVFDSLPEDHKFIFTDCIAKD